MTDTRGVRVTAPGSDALALAILDDFFGKQPDRAAKIAQRFKWRVVTTWTAGAPWSISEDEVRQIVADIEGVERQMAPAVRQMGMDRAPVATLPQVAGDYGQGDNNKLIPNDRGDKQ